MSSLLFLLVLLIGWIIISYEVGVGSVKRGMYPTPTKWGLIVFIFGIFGLIAYLICLKPKLQNTAGGQSYMEQDLKRKSILRGIVGAGALVIGASGLIVNGVRDGSVRHTLQAPIEIPVVPSAATFTLIESKTISDMYSRFIVGTVKNNTATEFSYVQIEFNLYDKNGAQVGSTFANVSNLEAFGTWKFKALIFEETARSYKLKDITGF